MSMNEDRAAALRRDLEALMESESCIRSLLLATPDGRCIQAIMPEMESRNKIAAMASSILAVAEKMAEFEGTGSCRQLLIEGTDGFATLRRISKSLVLVLTLDRTGNLGFLSHFTRQCEKIVISHIKAKA